MPWTDFDKRVSPPCFRSHRSPGNADRDFGSDVGTGWARAATVRPVQRACVSDSPSNAIEQGQVVITGVEEVTSALIAIMGVENASLFGLFVGNFFESIAFVLIEIIQSVRHQGRIVVTEIENRIERFDEIIRDHLL